VSHREETPEIDVRPTAICGPQSVKKSCWVRDWRLSGRQGLFSAWKTSGKSLTMGIFPPASTVQS
jgi:hypothetical protein